MNTTFLAPQGLALHVERSLNAVINTGDGPVVIRGEEYQFLGSLDRFMRIVLLDDLAPFVKVSEPPLEWLLDRSQRLGHRYQGRRQVKIQEQTPAAYYLPIIHTCGLFVSPTEVQFAPQLQCLIDAYRKHPIRHWISGKPRAMIKNGLLESDAFNDFVRVLRSMAVERRLRKAMGNWELNCVEAQRNLLSELRMLFSRHSVLSAIHLNLRLAQCDSIGIRGTFSHDERLQDDFELLRKYRRRFLDNLRRKSTLFKGLVRYVWAVEWSHFSGYSMHITLLFDQRHVAFFGSHPESFANDVGNYWERTTTEERGTYQLCHLAPQRYRDDWVFGAVARQDSGRRENLQRALSFLAMKHLLVRPKGLPPGAKLFQIGGSST
jgi:hypothetical protein